MLFGNLGNIFCSGARRASKPYAQVENLVTGSQDCQQTLSTRRGPSNIVSQECQQILTFIHKFEYETDSRQTDRQKIRNINSKNLSMKQIADRQTDRQTDRKSGISANPYSK